MLRALIAGLYAVFGVIFSMPAHWHFASLAKKDPKKAWLKSSHYVRGFFKNIMFLSGTKVDVIGLENYLMKIQACFSWPTTDPILTLSFCRPY